MADQFSRTQLLYGEKVMKRLASCRVAVFGVGGVGGYTVEALARSGIGALDLIDNDKVCLSNLNRQILATFSTIGEYKVDVAERRIHDIHPDCVVRTYRTFYLPQTQDQFDFSDYDYVVDAIDTVTGKLTIIENAKRAGIPVISSMGAGNKTDPTAFEVTDLYKTSVCPLAKVMRRECKKRGIDALKVVYSKEKAIKPLMEAGEADLPAPGGEAAPPGAGNGADLPAAGQEFKERRAVPGSTAFVPSVAGLIIAGEVINDLAGRMQDR